MKFREGAAAARQPVSGRRAWFYARLITLINVYATYLLVWAVLRFFFQDRWSWLFLINALAFYLFMPLPLALIVAFLVRRRVVWLGTIFGLILWLALYGGLFLPKGKSAQAAATTLTVMNSSLLGHNGFDDATIAAIRASGADVVALGELNYATAAAVEEQLSDLYPYQVLIPLRDVHGRGIISRYPLQSTGERLDGGDQWIGDPLPVTMDFEGEQIHLIHFHAIPLGTAGGNVAGLMFSINEREKQAQAILEYVMSKEEPVIALGDLNATDQHRAYGMLTEVLKDAWREAGWGLGHTFPGASSRYSSRPVIFGVPSPKWMIRIDYIFHSDEWQTESAWIGPWDGLSDHRPVMARLVLKGEDQ